MSNIKTPPKYCSLLPHKCVLYKNLKLSLFLIVLQENVTDISFGKCWLFITNHQYQGKSCFQEERKKLFLGPKLPKNVLYFPAFAAMNHLDSVPQTHRKPVKQNTLTSKCNFLGRWLTELSTAICSPFPLFLTRWTELGFVLLAGFFAWPWPVSQGKQSLTVLVCFPLCFFLQWCLR